MLLPREKKKLVPPSINVCTHIYKTNTHLLPHRSYYSTSTHHQSHILATLPSTPTLNTYALSLLLSHPHNTVTGIAQSLAADEYVLLKPLKTTFYVLTEEGKRVGEEGSPEARCFEAIKAKPMTKQELETAVGKDAAKVGMGNCMKNKWINKSGDLLTSSADAIDDAVKNQLSTISATPEDSNADCLPQKTMTILKKRKLIKQETRTSYDVTQGPCYQPVRKKRPADLTKEMLDSGEVSVSAADEAERACVPVLETGRCVRRFGLPLPAPVPVSNVINTTFLPDLAMPSSQWDGANFKDYNFATAGTAVSGGFLHPLLKVRAEFRKVLTCMGFEEMPTNKVREGLPPSSSFERAMFSLSVKTA